MMGGRVRNTFADTPYLFFVVVIGVALTFRLGIGALRSSSTAEPEAPVFASTEAATAPSARSGNAIAPANDSPTAGSSPSTNAGTNAVTNTAAGGPSPARTTPRPRGHGRRTPHGG